MTHKAVNLFLVPPSLLDLDRARFSNCRTGMNQEIPKRSVFGHRTGRRPSVGQWGVCMEVSPPPPSPFSLFSFPALSTGRGTGSGRICSCWGSKHVMPRAEKICFLTRGIGKGAFHGQGRVWKEFLWFFSPFLFPFCDKGRPIVESRSIVESLKIQLCSPNQERDSQQRAGKCG